MTQTVLPQLKEIASELVDQETSLVSQLEEVREKLAGVRAVMPLFGADTTEAKAATVLAEVNESPAEEASDKEPSTAKGDAAKGAAKKTVVAPVEEEETEEEIAEPESKVEEKAPRKKATKTKTSKKKDGRTASWQKYTRPGVKEKTIPEAVRIVLETQPDKSFKIAEVMDSLFKDGMPKQQYLKARNRISNILSGGVRDGEWFKGDRGTYSLTES
ncbi:MAG: hypothetical protein WA984_03555 [Phormidesmis sp.]